MAIRRGRKADAPQNTEEITVNTENTPDFGTEPEFAPTVDLDVDAPELAEPTAEDTVATSTDAAPKDEKPAKKESTRPPVPEGKQSPVQFAKTLTEYLRKPHEQFGVRLAEDKVVAPQVVYSYIKNNGEGSKNPFPATKAEGRAAVVDADAAIEWWDAKDARVAASKAGAAEKAAKKAERAAAKPVEGATPVAVTEQPELVEAE